MNKENKENIIMRLMTTSVVLALIFTVFIFLGAIYSIWTDPTIAMGDKLIRFGVGGVLYFFALAIIFNGGINDKVKK